MGKIGTSRGTSTVEVESAGQVSACGRGDASSWWVMPVSRKVAHFEALIEALAAAAVAATQRPPASCLFSPQQQQRQRRARARRGASAPQFDLSEQLRALIGRGSGSSDDDEGEFGSDEDQRSPASLMAQMTSEVERIRKRRDRRRRRRMTTQWGKVDPTMWPFDMKVNFFADLACEHRLREAIDDGWTQHKRAREEAARSPPSARRAQPPARAVASVVKPEQLTKRVEEPMEDEHDRECTSMEVEEMGSFCEEDDADHHADEEELALDDDGEPLVTAADEVEAVNSSYVGEVQIRCVDESKSKKRRKRREAQKKRLRRSKELEKESKKRRQDGQEQQQQERTDKVNGSTYSALHPNNPPQKPKAEAKKKIKKWEESKGRVHRELVKMWNRKHVKRGVFRFERHLADREVLGMECLDWKRHKCSNIPTATQLESLPFFSHSTNALGDDSTLIVVGGKDSKGRGTAAVRFLDTNTMQWSSPNTVSGPAPAFLFGHSASRVGRSLYLFGGYDQGGLSPRIYKLDISPGQDKVTWSVSHFTSANGDKGALQALYRVGHTVVRRGDELLLFGGHNGKQWCNDLYAFDLVSMTWRAVPTVGAPPASRGFHTATIVGSSLLVYGGTNIQRTFADTHVLDLDTLVWTTVIPHQPITAIPIARHSHAAARLGENVIILGGRTKSGVAQDCWLFNIYTKKWTRMKETNEASCQALGLSSHTLTLLRSNRLVVVGGKGATSLSGDVWMASTIRLPLASGSAVNVIDYDDLELGEEVGRGSFAKVMRASLQDCDGNKVECAVKKLRKMARKNDENELSHFKQEVSLLSKLNHPNVVKLVGVCTKPRCIITEFMSGGSLSEFLRQRGSLLDDEPSLLTSIALDIAKGGQYLHHQHVIHRDIKSHNILLDENFNAKIADLGVSRITTETSTMTCVGSAQWTAPEILRHQPYDQAVDVYSYGIVLWELLSGCQPYSHMSRLEAAVAVASTQLRPEIFAHWPERWTRLMQRCWHESPAERPTFDQIVDYLESQ